MKHPSDQALAELIDRYVDGSITESEFVELQETVKGSPKKLRFYQQYVGVHGTLREARPLPGSLTNVQAEPARQDAPSSGVTIAPIGHISFGQLAALGSLLCLLIVCGFAWTRYGRDSGVAGTTEFDPQVAANLETPIVTQSEDSIYDGSDRDVEQPVSYVAQVTSVSSDLAWGDRTDAADFFYRVGLGNRIELDSGLVEISYFSGAKIILRGPSRYVVTGEASGTLESGELTGHVSEGDFTLMTPSAKVIDLGTEFGVLVDQGQNTDVCVFDGKVQVVSKSGVDKDSQPITLSEGMAARANHMGQLVSVKSLNEDRFARSLEMKSSDEPDELSLINLFINYSPGQSALALAINAATGMPLNQDDIPKSGYSQPKSSGSYEKSDWHAVLDGVFIPPHDGSEIQIDTAGSRHCFPTGKGKTSGPIWARLRTETPSSIFNQHFWGRGTLHSMLNRMNRCEWGMMGIHANVGVTFDLDALRAEYGTEPVELRTLVGTLDNSAPKYGFKEGKRPFIASFQVLIDGVIKKERLRFGKVDGDMEIRVPISQADRFLTLATTDCGNIWFDQVLLIDPVIRVQ